MKPLYGGVEGSSAVEGMDFRLLCLLCVVYVVVSVTNSPLAQRSPSECVRLVV